MLQKMTWLNIVIITMIMTCAPLSNDLYQSSSLPHPGMKKILSAGKSFQQGWNDLLASPDEKPGMVSSFTYDYWLDTTEVTRKLYFDMMGRNPVSDSAQYSVGEMLPVVFVTWFDAVLFCNARSKADGLDTVYRYLSKYSYPDGSSSQINGLLCDFSKDGYRLPTEAEWEFAARGESSSLPFCTSSDLPYAQRTAWFGANASGKAQPVATKIPNAFGFYDLAGNVSEWTNDWKGPYNGKTITNSLGISQPNGNYEKVIKGGAYDNSLMYLRPSYRSAACTTTVSLANPYIGFRCARGALPNGHYFDPVVRGAFNFALDSLGVYFDPPVKNGGQEGFAEKMYLFWKLHNDLDLIFIGDNTLYCGVDCSVYTRYKALNMGFDGCGMDDISTIIADYLFVHAQKLKLIGIHVPFYYEPYVMTSFDSSIGKCKGCRYDKAHNYWKDGIPEGFDEIMAKQPFPSLAGSIWGWDSLGLAHWPCNGWGDTVPNVQFAKSWSISDSSYIHNFTVLIKIIQDASAHNIHLLAINFPESPYFKNTPWYGRLGPDRETGRAVLAQLKALETMYPYFHVYDAYNDGDNDYTGGDANSVDQLCPSGAKKLTGRLDMLINSILNR
jgi:formylglycine-generating enzyme required for sulfatase activity